MTQLSHQSYHLYTSDSEMKPGAVQRSPSIYLLPELKSQKTSARRPSHEGCEVIASVLYLQMMLV